MHTTHKLSTLTTPHPDVITLARILAHTPVEHHIRAIYTTHKLSTCETPHPDVITLARVFADAAVEHHIHRAPVQAFGVKVSDSLANRQDAAGVSRRCAAEAHVRLLGGVVTRQLLA